MAVPKRKISKSRRNQKRSHLAITAINMSVCPECGQSKIPHRVCKCGYYKGIEYINVEE